MTIRADRRGFLAGASAAALAMQTGLSFADDKLSLLKGGGNLVVASWGGAFTQAQSDAYFKPFSAATGISVITAGPPDLAKMNVMKAAGNVEWDLVTVEGWMLYSAIKQDLLQPLDYNFIDKIIVRSEYDESMLTKYGFPDDISSWVMIWNTKTYPNGGPKSWVDVWDIKKFPGRRAFYARPKPLLEYALLADGVPPAKLYPLDLDRAFASLDRLRPHINVFFETVSQGDLMMQNGEVDILALGSSRAYRATLKKLPVDYSFNQGVWEQSFWVVPKGAKNAASAMKLIAWLGQADRQAAFMKLFPQGMPNKKAYEALDPAYAAVLSGAPKNLAKEVPINSRWWTDNSDEVNHRWLAWYIKK